MVFRLKHLSRGVSNTTRHMAEKICTHPDFQTRGSLICIERGNIWAFAAASVNGVNKLRIRDLRLFNPQKNGMIEVKTSSDVAFWQGSYVSIDSKII